MLIVSIILKLVQHTSCYSLLCTSDATFGVEFDSYAIEENDGPAEVCVVFHDGCLERELDIGYATFDATAISMYHFYI